MKRSKRPEGLTKKGEFSPHALPISGRSLKDTLGASWHWQVGVIPRQVSSINRMRSPWKHRAGFHSCFAQGVTHSHKNSVELVKYSRKRVF